VIFWLDAHLSPKTAVWMTQTLGVEAFALRDLHLRDASDEEIFAAAKAAGVVVVTKDEDFPVMLRREGPPPQVVWLRCGNTSNFGLQRLLARAWPDLERMVQSGEPLIELREAR
jgi:predicted nuclease of predicted toxin-antitoxin system